MSKKQSIILILIIIGAIVLIFAWILYKNTDQTNELVPVKVENVNQTETGDAPAGQEKNGGVYTQAITAPPHLDPVRNASADLTDITINIYESLYELDAYYRPVPALATSCQISEEGKRYTFTLRRGVKFHDGSAMTAEDVLASFEYWLSYGDNADIRNEIVGYGISEENYLFYIELKEAYAPFLGRISNYVDNQRLVVMPKEVAVTGNENTMIEIPCGTGPYKFADWIPGKYCKLTRFDDYTPFSEIPASGYSGEKTAYFKDVIFRFFSDSDDRLAALKAGEINYAGKITIDDYEALTDDDTVNAVLGPIKKQSMFIFNCGAAPFNDINVRLAVLTGINIDEIAEIAVSGNRDYWSKQASLCGSSSPWYIQDAGEDVYNIHDLDLSKEYLAASSYDGAPVALLVDHKDPTQFLATQVFQSQLEKIGFRTKLVSLDQAALNSDNGELSDWHIYTVDFDTTYYDPLFYAALINKDTWLVNWHDANADIMNNIYHRLALETDQAKRLKIVKEWNEEFYRTAPAIKSFSYRPAYLFSKDFDSAWIGQLGVMPEGVAYNAWFIETADTGNQ